MCAIVITPFAVGTCHLFRLSFSNHQQQKTAHKKITPTNIKSATVMPAGIVIESLARGRSAVTFRTLRRDRNLGD